MVLRDHLAHKVTVPEVPDHKVIAHQDPKVKAKVNANPERTALPDNLEFKVTRLPAINHLLMEHLTRLLVDQERDATVVLPPLEDANSIGAQALEERKCDIKCG